MKSLISALAVLLGTTGCGIQQERQWPAQPDSVDPLIFSADGKKLFSGGKDSIRVWNPDTGTLKLQLPTGKPSTTAAISPDGRLLALSTKQREIGSVAYGLELWNPGRSSRAAQIEQCSYALTFSPDGTKLATATCLTNNGGNTDIKIWRNPDLTLQATYPRPLVSSLCFSPDGKLLASGEGNLIHLMDVETGKLIRTLKGPPSGWVVGSSFNAAGTMLTAVIAGENSQNGSVWTWDISTGQAKLSSEFDHNVNRNASFSADGRRVAVWLLWYGFGRNERVEVWDTAAGCRLGTVESRNYISSIALTPDGNHLAIGFQQPGGIRGRAQKAPIGMWRIR